MVFPWCKNGRVAAGYGYGRSHVRQDAIAQAAPSLIIPAITSSTLRRLQGQASGNGSQSWQNIQQGPGELKNRFCSAHGVQNLRSAVSAYSTATAKFPASTASSSTRRPRFADDYSPDGCDARMARVTDPIGKDGATEPLNGCGCCQ